MIGVYAYVIFGNFWSPANCSIFGLIRTINGFGGSAQKAGGGATIWQSSGKGHSDIIVVSIALPLAFPKSPLFA